MAMSTVEVRSPSVHFSNSERTSIIPSNAAENKTGFGSKQAQGTTTNQVRLPNLWLAEGQNQVTQAQIAEQSLRQVGTELSNIKQQLARAMQLGVADKPSLDNKLSASQKKIKSIIDTAQFDGVRVVDHQLQLNLSGAQTRRFSIPGLNVQRLSEKAEEIKLDFPHGHSVMVNFDGLSSGRDVVDALDRSLIPMGLRASLAKDGTVLFQVSESIYQQMQQKVRVSGQGHRFPAGQANNVKLKPEPEGVIDWQIETHSRESIRRSLVKVNQFIRAAQEGIEHTHVTSDKLQQSISQTYLPQTSLSSEELSLRLAKVNPQTPSFSTAFQALNAQASVRRHSVVALLKS